MEQTEQEAFGSEYIARICRVTRQTVARWVRRGTLPSFSTGGGQRRVWARDLADFLKAHNIPVPPKLQSHIKQKVLVVDDEAMIRRVVCRLIKKEWPGVEVHEAADGFEAGRAVTQTAFSLVVLDIWLPGVDGLKICRMIRGDKKANQTAVLAMSGHDPDDIGPKAIAAGANGFVAKPFDIDDLTEKLADLLSSKKRW